MNALHIFRAGKHRDSRGREISFSAEDLAASVAAYDPAKHEAPIVVGHPTENGPAYGWISKLSIDDTGNVFADPAQVNPDFAELVKSGAYKKISASWYLPEAPENPAPGSYYLRHVGFLGAQPPAIKGLKEIAFADAAESHVDFGAWEDAAIARVFRAMREWWIDKFSRDEADQIIPAYVIEDLEAAARREQQAELETPQPAAMPVFSETDDEDHSMTREEIEALQAKAAEADALKAAQAAKEAEFAERDRALAVREAEARRAAHVATVEQLIVAGRATPAMKDRMVAFLEALPAGAVVSFTEGDTTTQKDLAVAFRELIEAYPAQINFGEAAPRTEGDEVSFGESAEQTAKAITEYVEAERGKGRTIDHAQAFTELKAKQKAAG